MALRVAFDLDGTLADMDAAVVQIASELFGTSDEPGDRGNGDPRLGGGVPPALDALTARQQSELWGQVERTENFWTCLAETEAGIVARIAATAHARRWEVIFITTRPPTAGDTTQTQTQHWLEAHGFARPSVFVVTGSRGKVAEALTLDAVVDDQLDKAVDVAVESQARAILVRDSVREEALPSATRLGVKVVSSIGDAVTMLECLDDLKNGSGVLESIKRMLTFKG
ncbi:MAG: hypothetical protein GEV06_03655 [Luteitalea sp.]|nr:hypothetical protein [Luteitalea sp.]